MIVNRQGKVRIDMRATRAFVSKLQKCLRLGRRNFNICFVEDWEMARLNATYRGKAKPTDVLSFPWQPAREGLLQSPADAPRPRATGGQRANRANFEPGGPFSEIFNFLGDIVISAETARRNARGEGHSTPNEIRWLILHGVLHLLGYDHATDHGEMTTLELSLRARLGI
jgi:probable rRNA maturation factor